MKTFIAIFEASYEDIDTTQHSCITWQQQNDKVDSSYIVDLIRNTTAVHFFRIVIGEKANIQVDKIKVSLGKIEKLN